MKQKFLLIIYLKSVKLQSIKNFTSFVHVLSTLRARKQREQSKDEKGFCSFAEKKSKTGGLVSSKFQKRLFK
jgi:hypothetical protein